MDASTYCPLTLVAVFAWSFPSAAADGTTAVNWHASQVSLRRLYGVQARHLGAAKTYLASETDRLRDLERAYSSIFEWFASNSSVKNAFMLNHLNGVQLMKRMYNAQLEITSLLNNERSIEAIKNVYEEEAINELNLLAVYRSLRRLQKVYAIPASDMAAGRHKNRIIGDPLDACECYAMVKYGFENSDAFGIVDWMVQVYRKWLDNRPKCVDMDKLLNYMQFTSIVTGYSFDGLPNFQEVRHSKNTSTIDRYMSLMERELSLQHVNAQPDIYETYDNFEKHSVFKNFRHLCKTGESKQSPTADFKCRYQTKNDPYRAIMPFKEEDISHDPYLKLYHDMIFEEEIKYIIDSAEKDLSDAAFYSQGKISLVEDKRLGQLKWFSESANPKLFNRLNDRVECLTGFSTKTAEGYQTVNYGVGGHFSVHVDAFTDGPKKHGNRLITVLFYMTDVVDDGYTIFPNLNYVAHCRRGTAMIWRNLYVNNGTVHSGTFHGGCPVLKGNKWIMTKGLYEGGQPLAYDWTKNKKIYIV